MKKLGILVVLGALTLFSLRAQDFVPSPLQPDQQTNSQVSLFAQSAAQAVWRVFNNCRDEQEGADNPNCSHIKDTSYLLLDAHSDMLLASRWEHPQTPIPLGSLVKPFAALAYGEQHEFKYPRYICRGTASGCWFPHGHGELGIEAAIADSCNSYFRMLTAQMRVQDIQSIVTNFGLQSPDADAAGANFAGLGGHWNISPLAMAHAYLELNQRRNQPGAREVIAGMVQSARQGTASELGRALAYTSALAKTGTASCTHAERAPGDGFVIAMVPVEDPQILLLVRVHGAPGAQAARVAGQILHEIGE